jgi:hypothetical protein
LFVPPPPPDPPVKPSLPSPTFKPPPAPPPPVDVIVENTEFEPLDPLGIAPEQAAYDSGAAAPPAPTVIGKVVADIGRVDILKPPPPPPPPFPFPPAPPPATTKYSTVVASEHGVPPNPS